MTAADWYRARAALWTARHLAASRRALALSRWRLLTFFAGVVAAIAGIRVGAPALTLLGVAAFAAFAWCVVLHARVLLEIERAETALALAAAGLARIARDWHALDEVPPPAAFDIERHPYARDLDIYGHASLTKWLGRTATADGGMRLSRWLLAPAGAEEIAPRQAAVDELAAQREWREALAVEGRLSGTTPDGLSAFLEWAEDGKPAVPAAFKVLAIALPLVTCALLAWWLADALHRLPALTADTFGVWFDDAVTNGRWWLPVIVNIVLWRSMAARVNAVFDRAMLGQRTLERHAQMLTLVSGAAWQAPRLVALQSKLRAGGDAPALVRQLARLGGWSELRATAPLLHDPIQAFTLWDFHVLFGLERWREAAGRHVRGWLDALGEIDALAVLSIARADEPAWTMPFVDPASRELTATALGHPLMSGSRIDNDVTIGPPGTTLLITGSNMSGKSTLLRSIGLNAVLAQAGAPVCAAAFRMPPVEVRTSIHIRDSLELGLSYFMAALARLKEIVDAAGRHASPHAGPGAPLLLYLLDEVLQGTNSVERGLAVRAVAQHLLDAGAIGAMTTHDLALAGEEPLHSAAVLVHFTEQVHDDGTMTFDYRLRPGLATSTNALRLMQAIGIAPR